jgi:hypothetical protein
LTVPEHACILKLGTSRNREDIHLTPQQVATMLGVCRGTLRNWDKAGTGPPLRRLAGGRVIRYPGCCLRAWLARPAEHLHSSGSR